MMIYVAVALVAGILIGFVTLCVVWTTRVVSQSIRDRSVLLLSTYDGLLEDRSRSLQELKQELEQAKAGLEQLKQADQAALPVQESAEPDPMAFLRVVERISGTEYRDKEAGEIYRWVRENFNLAPEDVLAALPARDLSPRECPAGGLLKKLDYDSVYKLSTLPGEEQRTVLSQVLSQKERKLLEDYAETHPKFDCIAFYDYLQARAAEEPKPVCLRVAPTAVPGKYPPQVRVVVDEEICEGFQIERDNILYDYCVKMKEMGK